MSFGNIRQRTHAAAAAPQEPEGPQMCVVNGCPCIATVNTGPWTCSTHGFAGSEEWPRITEGLRNHDWLLAFTRDIQAMDRKHEDWRGFAKQFWAGQDDYCMPDPKEGCIPYFNRMKGELDHRLGLCKRPAPRLPQPPVKGRRFGNIASKVAA